LLLEVIAGKDPMDPRQSEVPVQQYTNSLSKDLRSLTIGAVREGFGTPVSEAGVDAKVRSAIRALEESGAQTQEISIPAHLEAGGIIWALLAEGMAALMYGNGVGYHWKGLYNESLANALGRSLQAQAQDLSEQVKFTLLVGSYLNRAYHGRLYAKAQNQRRLLQEAYGRALEQVDVLVMPTTPMTAHRYNHNQTVGEQIGHGWNMLANTAPFNFTGHPSLSVPCGKSNGLPVGMMLSGRHFDDGTLLRVAYAFEQQTSWEKR
jgi:amidase